jgi:hypothetical protein
MVVPPAGRTTGTACRTRANRTGWPPANWRTARPPRRTSSDDRPDARGGEGDTEVVEGSAAALLGRGDPGQEGVVDHHVGAEGDVGDEEQADAEQVTGAGEEDHADRCPGAVIGEERSGHDRDAEAAIENIEEPARVRRAIVIPPGERARYRAWARR